MAMLVTLLVASNILQKMEVKQKFPELSWHTIYRRGEDARIPIYDEEVSGELFVASPEHLSMASSGPSGRKRDHHHHYASDVNQSHKSNIRIVDRTREFGSPGLGNVAWKE